MNREPRRLLDQAPRAGSTESHLRDLIARQSAAEPLSAAQLARVRRVIAARTETRQANWTIVAWAAAGAIVIATTSMGWAQNGSLGARIRDTGSQLVASVLGQRPSAHRRAATPAPTTAREAPAAAAVQDTLTVAPAALPAAEPVADLPQAPAEAPRALPGLLPIPVAAATPAAPLAREAPLALPTTPKQPVARPPIAAQTRPNALAAAPSNTARDRLADAPAPTAAPSASVSAAPSAAASVPLTAPVQGPLALEADSLREIATLLQAPQAPSAAATALQKLAVYRERFPNGALAAEADLAELNADVALDCRAEALGLLTRLERRGGLPPAELRLLHGELLAKGGDCAGALDRWGDGLPAAPALAERTLYGRASCYAALGRTGESRAAMGAYLNRFPQGRFAAAVRAAMAPKQP